ncbi:MAG: outer membrane protein transport protein [Candidatus Hydrogenedentes bacterium]|nr:outer membrane protein transport protein [Candidatus Hydrogenedentota bacterium]
MQKPTWYKWARLYLPCSLALAAAALLLPVAEAQLGGEPLSVNSSPNVVGSGARARGMGGAFIAVADDATAASWNPGGLTQLERPEISLVYSYKVLSEEFSKGLRLWPNDDFSVDFDDLNYASVVYPLQRTIAGRNLVFSINYQHKFDFDREMSYRIRNLQPVVFPGVGSGIAEFLADADYKLKGSLSSISPAVGFELTNRFSVGMAVNLWDSSLLSQNGWSEHFRVRSRLIIPAFNLNAGWTWTEVDEDYEDFRGTNYTIGFLYKPTPRLSIGGVYHTKFAGDVKYKRTGRTWFPHSLSIMKEDRRLEFPSALGLGVAYRFPNDKLTLSLDVTRREWDEFVESDAFGRRFSPITGLPKYQSHHDPTYTVRLGAEYVFVDPSRPAQKYLPSLRLGALYDPEPSGGRQQEWYGLGRVTGEPDEYYGVTFGLGLLIHNRVNLDFAYEYRWGNDVRLDTFGLFEPDSTADVDQHEFFLSTVIYFK